MITKPGIFIVGYPRSGTTLVQQLVSRDNQVCTFPETQFLSIMNPITIKRFFIPKIHLLNKAIVYFNRVTGSKFSLRDLEAPFICKKKYYLKMYFNMLDSLIIKPKYNRWCEKTPRHLHFAQDLLTSNPSVLVICVVRNPVAAINSLYRVTNSHPREWNGKSHGMSLNECILRWKEDLLRAYRLIDCPRVAFVDYDTLLDYEYKTIEYLNVFLDCEMKVSNQDVNLDVIESHELWKKNNEHPIFNKPKTYDNDDYIMSRLYKSDLDIYFQLKAIHRKKLGISS